MAKNTQYAQLNDLATKAELLSFMECPVCTEIPFPPIYMCIKGHNICKNCKQKLNECPTCKESLSAETRNYTVEQMVLASKHSCCYKEDGCLIELRGELMENHLKECSYRPFKCPWFGMENCSTNLLRLSLAQDHIFNDHLLTLLSTNPTTHIHYGLSFTKVTKEGGSLLLLEKPQKMWRPNAIEFDGKLFFTLTFSMDEMICLTVLCVGSEDDAQKYHVKIICKSDKEEIQWDVPVKSITKGTELMNSETRHGFIPSCTVDDFIEMAVKDEVDSKYYFTISYAILKR